MGALKDELKGGAAGGGCGAPENNTLNEMKSEIEHDMSCKKKH